MDGTCAVCRGTGALRAAGGACAFCNGTGTASAAADSFMRTHACMCAMRDRATCPVCERKCHHDTPFRPRIEVPPA